MADPAHDETEKLIKEMEKRINCVYKQAQKEVAEKCDNYFRRHYIKDKLKREQLQAGLITKEEYQECQI